MPDGDAGGAGGGFKMGDAFVEVHIDADGPAKKAAAELRKSKKYFDAAARDIGDSAGETAGERFGSTMVASGKRKLAAGAAGIGEAAGTTTGERFGSTTVAAARQTIGRQGGAVGKDLIKSVLGDVPAAVASSQAVIAASERVVKAQNAEQTQLGKLRLARMELQELQAKGNATARQLATAVEHVSKAERDASAAHMSSANALKRLTDVREQAIEAARKQAALDADAANVKIGFTAGFDALKKDSVKSLGAIGILGGAAMAGGLGAGLAAAGPAALIIGVGAILAAQDQQVEQSINQLGRTIQVGSMRAVEPLTDSFANAADSMTRDLTQMGGSFQRLFQSAEPGIDDIASGITGLVRESLPGLITAGERSEVVFKGIGSAMTSTGKGVSEFFTNSSQAASSSAVIIASFGRIVQNALGFAGSFIAQLAGNGASTVVRFEQVLHQAEGTVLRIGQGAFPIAFGTGRELMNVFSGLLSVVGQFTPVLGPATGALLAFTVAGKAMNVLTFGRLGAELANVKTQFREADGARGKFSVGLGALGGGFGLAGAAALGVTTVLGILGQSQADAAKKTQQHQQRVDALATALRASNGVVDASVRASAAQTLADTKLLSMKQGVLTMVRELGISIPLFTDAYLGNAQAQGQVAAQLDAMIPKGLEWERVTKTGTEAEKKRAGWAALLKNAMADTNGELGQAVQKNKDLAAAASGAGTGLDNLRGAEDRAKKSSADLRAAFDTLASPMGDVATRGKAIADAFDRLTGRQPQLEETTKSWHEFMQNLKDTKFEDAAAGTKKWADALIEANGQINTATKDGRTLYDLVQRGRTDFDNMAAAMSAAGVPAGEMTTKLQGMRDELVNTLVKMGISKTEANNLANAYGLIPDTVTTLVSTGGTVSGTTSEVMILGGRLKGLPPNTPVKVQALTDEARTLLESLGIKIKALPDGQFEVKPGTAAAAKNLEDFIWYWSRRQIGIPVVVSTPKNIPLKNIAGGMAAFAEGTDFAPGGLAVVGEKGPEIVSIPRGSKVYTNRESEQLVSGTTGSDGAVFPSVSRMGDTVTHNWYITAPAMPYDDLNALAELLSRKVEQRMSLGTGA